MKKTDLSDLADTLNKHTGGMLGHLHSRFHLPLLTAIPVLASQLTAQLGRTARIRLLTGEQIRPAFNILALDPAGRQVVYHASRWISLYTRRQTTRLAGVSQLQNPHIKAQLKAQYTMILEGDQARTDNLQGSWNGFMRREMDMLARHSTGQPTPEQTRTGEKAGSDLKTDLKHAARFLDQSTIQLSELIAGERPLMVVHCLTHDLIRDWPRLVFDGYLHLIGRGLSALPALTQGKTAQLDTARAFLAQLSGLPADDPALLGGQVLPGAGFSHCLTVHPGEFTTWISRPAISRSGLDSKYLLVRSPSEPIRTGSLSIGENKQVVRQMKKIWSARMAVKPVTIPASPEAQTYYESLQETPTRPDDPRSWYPMLVLKLAGSIGLLTGRPLDRQAMELSRAILEPALASQVEETGLAQARPCPDPTAEQALNTMIRKLLEKGPTTRRDLFRSYKIQRADIHQPVLDLGLERGKIVEQSGRYSVPCQPVSPSAPDSPVKEPTGGDR